MIRAFAILAALSFFMFDAAARPGIAFERGDSVWIANLDGTSARKIAKGSGPDLSPDGNRVAFNTDTSTKKEVIRQIAVADLASKKVTVFKNGIPSTNCQGAIWSPDGTHILFEIFTDADWHLALVNADGSGFRYLRKAWPKGNSFWSACWAPDGRSIYAQNLDSIFQIDLDGKELNKWSIAKLFPNGGLNSETKFSLSPNGKILLMDVDMQDETANMPDWDGPPPALWIYDFATRTATRLTPKDVLVSKPSWLNETQILFTAQEAGATQPSIYLMNVAEETKKMLIKNASNASVPR